VLKWFKGFSKFTYCPKQLDNYCVQPNSKNV
jgi:hypothetical protein